MPHTETTSNMGQLPTIGIRLPIPLSWLRMTAPLSTQTRVVKTKFFLSEIHTKDNKPRRWTPLPPKIAIRGVWGCARSNKHPNTLQTYGWCTPDRPLGSNNPKCGWVCSSRYNQDRTPQKSSNWIPTPWDTQVPPSWTLRNVRYTTQKPGSNSPTSIF